MIISIRVSGQEILDSDQILRFVGRPELNATRSKSGQSQDSLMWNLLLWVEAPQSINEVFKHEIIGCTKAVGSYLKGNCI